MKSKCSLPFFIFCFFLAPYKSFSSIENLSCSDVESPKSLTCEFDAELDLNVFSTPLKLHQIQRKPVYSESHGHGSIALIKNVALFEEVYESCWTLSYQNTSHTLLVCGSSFDETPQQILDNI